MDYLKDIDAVLCALDSLSSNDAFLDLLAGDDQGFLDTCWDFFERLEESLTVTEPEGEDDPILWRMQQDADID